MNECYELSLFYRFPLLPFRSFAMCLKSASTDMLVQLTEVIGQLTDADYARPLPVLSGNTIGKHVRHILECYELLVTSAETEPNRRQPR